MNDITSNQALIIWCLLGKHGQALQSELLPRVAKKDREALEASGLVSCEKRQRGALFLKVEDKGWRWASEHLRGELPREYQVLQHWLAQLHNFLDKNDENLAGFIGPAPTMLADPGPRAISEDPPKRKRGPAKKPGAQPKAKKAPAQKVGKPAGKKPLKTPKRPTGTELRRLIESAYLRITSGQKAKAVPLRKIRAELSALDAATVDAGLLRILQDGGKIRLHQISDPKALTQADRDAVFSPGGEPFHLLWIES